MIKIVTKTTTLHRHTALITEGMLREVFGLPDTAVIRFYVPGGGDWSNALMSLDDSSDGGLHVEWTETEHGEDD